MHNSQVRTVSVEFLRAGPPHNQLLSPLTRYLAVCGDGRVGEITVPYEHSEFVRRLQSLRYLSPREGERAHQRNAERQAALIELSRQMSQILSSIPGLTTQISPHHCGAELVHLQFVISAAELAMLPFELSGTLEQPGAAPGNYIQLNGKPLITMTRRSRGAVDQCVRWPTAPRILFVAADPEQPIPYQAHVDALVKALQPWLPALTTRSNDEAGRDHAYAKALSAHLKVLKRATISKIAEECLKGNYTHVHVLAHGANDPSSPGRHFGLALHSAHDENKAHVVSGAQFASALRRDGDHGAPTIVTLAACDAGNVHDVMYTGASFAQDLHRAGIPFVVASQFPLSIPGSEIMAEELYKHLLLGKDPRQLLCDVRLRLHSVYAGVAHDWASLVAYATFPADLEAQLLDTQYARGRLALNTALQSLDREMAANGASCALAEEIKEGLFKKVDDAFRALPKEGPYLVEGLGLRAAADKRRAEFCFKIFAGRRHRGEASTPNACPLDRIGSEVIAVLERAMDTYDRAFREGVRSRTRSVQNAPLHWAITQKLSLQAVLEGKLPDGVWNAAWELAEYDHNDAETLTWAHSSQLELLILRWWIFGADSERLAQQIREHAERLIALVPEPRFPLHSTERQLRRYTEWWWSDEFRALLAQHQRSQALPAPAALIEVVDGASDLLRAAFDRGKPRA